MTDPLRAIILGVVEGITEFLPISSTGHMILVERRLGIAEADPFWSGAFDIFIQIGAILAVVVYFWRRLVHLIISPRRSRIEPAASLDVARDTELVEVQARVSSVDAPIRGDGPAPEHAPLSSLEGSTPSSWSEHILIKLFVAFLPAAFVGVLARKFIEHHLKTPPVVAGALIVGGIAILIIERFVRNPRFPDAARIPLRIALWIGIAQCLSLVPGTSRSAATIMGALVLGLTHAAAAEFSFFLAIPTMFAAGGYSLFKHRHDIHHDQFALLGLGFSIAFVVALLVISAFMRFIQTHKFTPFAYYRILLGALVLWALHAGFFAP